MAHRREEVHFRTAREQDLEALISIHYASFPDSRGREARRRNFIENPRGALDDLLVAELGSRIVGHGFLFRMETWVGGRPLGVGGVASIGVAPEARQSGVARAMLVQMLHRMRSRAAPVSMLYPFRHDFYQRLGWGLSGALHRYRFRPQALTLSPERSRVRPFDSEDTAPLRRCYERHAPRNTGMLARGDAVWCALLQPEGTRVAVVPSETASAALDGYIVYRFAPDTAAHAMDLDVLELVALTDETARALRGFLSAQRDQVARVHLNLPVDQPLHALLSDPRGPTSEMIRGLMMVSAELTVGVMTRIVDVGSALRARGYEGVGQLVVRAEDTLMPDNCQPVTLRVDARRVEVEPGKAEGLPLLETDVSVLGQVFMGAITPSQAVQLGLARVEPTSALPGVDALLHTRPAHTLDIF